MKESPGAVASGLLIEDSSTAPLATTVTSALLAQTVLSAVLKLTVLLSDVPASALPATSTCKSAVPFANGANSMGVNCQVVSWVSGSIVTVPPV